MKSFKIALIAAMASLSFGGIALAQDDDDAPQQRGAVSREQAVSIARGYGIVRIEEIEPDDGGWEIEGRDRQGREVEITINRQGRVTSVDRSNDG